MELGKEVTLFLETGNGIRDAKILKIQGLTVEIAHNSDCFGIIFEEDAIAPLEEDKQECEEILFIPDIVSISVKIPTTGDDDLEKKRQALNKLL